MDNEIIAHCLVAITDTGAGIHVQRRLDAGSYSLYKVGSVYLADDDRGKRRKFLDLLPQIVAELPPEVTRLHIAGLHGFLKSEELRNKANETVDMPVNVYGVNHIAKEPRQELRLLAEDAIRGHDLFAVINEW
ncbi:hypothetical protein [Salicibibacter kimchii]|uniref:Uncharacterized protein n=1 Tax=Salicibibacter kimchii TaxID=2099786 RepID=A0A345BV21_9BACI|nr:hypothetical protein [Salicibibacter kimchii]AXF54802.1 hypothetical protein DT065_01400 [Salicibibacter kimchii]